MKKFQKTFEKPLDKVKKMWYNIEVAAKTVTTRSEGLKKKLKKLKKVLKNLLTNAKDCGIIDRLSRKLVAALTRVRAIEP